MRSGRGYGPVILDRLRLPAAPTSPAVARRFVSGILDRAAFPGDRDGVVLMVSEVVTNAVLHAGEPIELVVEVDGGSVAVSVVDGEVDRMPDVRPPAGLDVPGGRGMAIVDTLADAWGYRPLADRSKAVWFTVGST